MLPTTPAPRSASHQPGGDRRSDDIVEQLIDAAAADRSLLRQILIASTDGIKLLDADGRLLSMNLAGQHILGAAEPASLMGTPWVDLWKGPEHQLAVAALERARGGGVGEFEAGYTDLTGGPRWRHVRVTPLFDASGALHRLLVISQETTYAKLISEHLAESESRERGIIESATDYAIFVMDVEGRITRWGKGAEKTFGYTAAEILHQDSAILWPAEDLPHAPVEERRLTIESGCADANRWHVRKDGTRFFARGALQPIFNAERVTTGFVKVCRDETSQLQIKTQLADARIRLEAALAAGEIATWVLDLVADKVYGDVNLLRFFGVSATESTGVPLATYLEAIHPDDRPRTTAEVQRAIEVTGMYESEYRINVGGSDRWVVARGKVERDAAGKPIRLPGVVLDITARKKAEQARRDSEARYRSLFDSIDEGFCIVEVIFDANQKPIDYIYLEVNPAFERQTGLVDAAGKSTRLLIPGLEEHWFETYGRVAKTGIPIRYENDAASMERSFDVYAFRIDEPALNRVAIIFKDTTEQRKMLASLKQSEEQLRQLADAMPQIVWAARPDGSLDYYNRRWFDFIGLPPDQFEQAAWDRYVHRDDMARVLATWTQSIRTGSLYQTEFRVKNAAGQYRWFLVRALPIRNNDSVITRWFGTCTDIEDQKEMQAQKEKLLSSERAARDEAERASQMKDEFLATLSHELRTPLNAILGWSQIIRSADHEPEDVTQGIEVIERNARAQSQIIEDLLDMSRIISGKVRLDVQRLDLSAIVQAAVETARPTASAKQVRLTSVIDPLHGVTVSGDANRMQQVLWNLLSNAVKFTPKRRPCAGAAGARELAFGNKRHRHRGRHPAGVFCPSCSTASARPMRRAPASTAGWALACRS